MLEIYLQNKSYRVSHGYFLEKGNIQRSNQTH